MRHREIIPTDDHQTGQTDRRVAAQADLRQGHWGHTPYAVAGWARKLFDELRADLTEDLERLGLPASTPSERTRLEMIAESMIAQTQALGLGILEGRYASIDDAVEVLTAFAVGILGLGPAL